MTLGDRTKMLSSKRDIYMDYLKGLAMIMLVLLHSIQMIDGLPEIIRKPILMGQIGVQLFLFCSGYLVMKSYSGPQKILNFYDCICFWRKKYIRLFVPFVIFMMIYLIMNRVCMSLQIDIPYANNTDILSIVLNIFLLHGLAPFCFNNVVPGGWYIGTLFILFVWTPFITAHIKKSKHMVIFSTVIALISIIFSVILHHFFAVDTGNGSFLYFSFLNQAPAYLMGMSVALDNTKTNISLKCFIFRDSVIAVVIASLFYFELSFSYAVIPFLSALMFVDVYKILTDTPNLVKKTKWICSVGQNTFAIYLSHFFVVWYAPLAIQKYCFTTGMTMWMITLCLAVMLCMFSPYLSALLEQLTQWTEKHLVEIK